ncbi:hypothetical protein [Fictibacillus barbaricus]|uniref:N-acetyltransferase domain-containing protein n=1 Tax=Fictibacillus barbaricus TaxID=182136 RepID=A0ABU1U6A3_9BACL|nr:hypothetical protein [Fictibacillus barbaricus]MDR7074908.1 hypothetical protein [Fictibacillus barbaricus]
MEVETALKEDLAQLSTWCEDVPEIQENLTQYLDRDDTTILMMKNNQHIAGIALLKIKERQKTGTIWLHLNEEGNHNHNLIMEKSLKWLRQKGAKEYDLV